MSTEQIKYMVQRFLQWKLPENFNPDGGISFKRMFNENTPWPMKNEPVGTNLFDAVQAEAMVRYMIDRMPERSGGTGRQKWGQCKCNCPEGPCDHDFQGMRPFAYGRGAEAVCTKCGMGAFEHSLWVGP